MARINEHEQHEIDLDCITAIGPIRNIPSLDVLDEYEPSFVVHLSGTTILMRFADWTEATVSRSDLIGAWKAGSARAPF